MSDVNTERVSIPPPILLVLSCDESMTDADPVYSLSADSKPANSVSNHSNVSPDSMGASDHSDTSSVSTTSYSCVDMRFILRPRVWLHPST
jgi:hypothetical protein